MGRQFAGDAATGTTERIERRMMTNWFLAPEDVSLNGEIRYRIVASDGDIPGDVSPKPTDQEYVLLVAKHKDKVAYYWIPETVLDDFEVDIWAEMWPSVSEQLGLTNA